MIRISGVRVDTGDIHFVDIQCSRELHLTGARDLDADTLAIISEGSLVGDNQLGLPAVLDHGSPFQPGNASFFKERPRFIDKGLGQE